MGTSNPLVMLYSKTSRMKNSSSEQVVIEELQVECLM